MSDPAEFLAARLDEDEARYREAAGDERNQQWALHESGDLNEGYIVAEALRMLREVAAKRAILARYEDCLARMEDPDYPHEVARDQAREYEDFVLPNLVAAYSDHSGYQQEWKP